MTGNQRLKVSEITSRMAALTPHGQWLAAKWLMGDQAFMGTLIADTRPAVRNALLAALAGAEAGQGLTEEPPGPDRSHALWRRPAGSREPWELLTLGPRSALLGYAEQRRENPVSDGIDRDYAVLPATGEHPGAGLPPAASPPSAGCDGASPDGAWLCTAVAGHEPLDHVAWDGEGTVHAHWPSVPAGAGESS